MRQLVVLVAGLLLMTGCAALRSVPSTETHIVSFELETVRPSTFADMKASYSLKPLADKKNIHYGKSWDRELTFHYPDVTELYLFGEVRVKEEPVLPPPAEAIDLRCRIMVDGVLVAENVGHTVWCAHTVTPGRQKRVDSSS
ncbi:hypothetical protein [Cryptosporangium aurantiacum]|uniref:Lipoprotein n=1 Tax=Cryptosporangium aurantiacum TaxID=134849 RepID=A0A1M7N3E1_9ACTN|nr:hypothetical protein [Cryptosporangium aurantiacum]SHM98050.1 hypothetical protein SAMN05443668_102400 [Cryptosporangium aurantiacum]